MRKEGVALLSQPVRVCHSAPIPFPEHPGKNEPQSSVLLVRDMLGEGGKDHVGDRAVCPQPQVP